MGKTTGVRWGVRLVLALLMLGWAVAAAPARADEPAKEMTPKDRDSLDRLSRLLTHWAMQEYEKQNYVTAIKYEKTALDICKRLYPTDKYPDGHPDLAAHLDNMGGFLDDLGDYDLAKSFYREALAMRKKLYPVDKYPDGHYELARSLNNLGALLFKRGEYGKAEPFCRSAVAMRKKLFPADKYPDGQPDLARSLNNLVLCWMNLASTARRSRTTATPWTCASACTRREVPRRTPRPSREPQQPGLSTTVAGRIRPIGAVAARRPGDADASTRPRSCPTATPTWP